MCPPFIMKLDFKSKEELQSMPTTEEEHIENQNLDYEDLEKMNADAEVFDWSRGLVMKKSVPFDFQLNGVCVVPGLLFWI